MPKTTLKEGCTRREFPEELGKKVLKGVAFALLAKETLQNLVGCAVISSGRTKPNISYPDLYPQTFSDEEAGRIVEGYRVNPRQYYKEMSDVLFFQLKEENPLLTKELGRLPEFQYGSSIQATEALEIIVDLYMNNRNSKLGDFCRQMLAEGKPEIRKYCTPLRYLFWIAENGEIDRNDLLSEDYSLAELYKSVHHRVAKLNFEEATEMLNSPRIVDIYEKFNFRYRGDGKEDTALSPRETHERKRIDCEDFSIFESFCLEKAGYETSVLISWWDHGILGHTVTPFKEDRKLKYLDNGRRPKLGIREECESYVDIGYTIAKDYGATPKRIWNYP